MHSGGIAMESTDNGGFAVGEMDVDYRCRTRYGPERDYGVSGWGRLKIFVQSLSLPSAGSLGGDPALFGRMISRTISAKIGKVCGQSARSSGGGGGGGGIGDACVVSVKHSVVGLSNGWVNATRTDSLPIPAPPLWRRILQYHPESITEYIPTLSSRIIPGLSSSITPTPSSSITPTPSSSLTPTPSSSITPTPSSSLTPTPSSSITPTPSSSLTPTPSSSITPTPSSSITPTPSSTLIPTPSSTLIPTLSTLCQTSYGTQQSPHIVLIQRIFSRAIERLTLSLARIPSTYLINVLNGTRAVPIRRFPPLTSTESDQSSRNLSKLQSFNPNSEVVQ
ncbi:choice-of-anchor A family protein [Venturia nashicola]|nr:choice-of-anchor A family protein [Venturia nashicola]